jgi:hypothetical protein
MPWPKQEGKVSVRSTVDEREREREREMVTCKFLGNHKNAPALVDN